MCITRGNSLLYHEGNRRLQDQFSSRGIADRLENVTLRQEFSEGDERSSRAPGSSSWRQPIADRRPDCSFKGGLPGFVRVTGPDELAFPDYDGNGMFKSLGSILVNP